MFVCFLKGILIGLFCGMPVGVVGAMTIQRTLSHGFKAGLETGLGSSVADCLYASVCAFGLTLVSDYLIKYQTVIQIAGGSFVVVMGIHMILRKARTGQIEQKTGDGIKMFLSSFVVGITNPAVILSFLFSFSYFGATGQSTGLSESILLVVGVFFGTYIWWGALAGMVNIVKKKTGKCCFPRVNKIFGALLTLFGVVVIIKAVL